MRRTTLSFIFIGLLASLAPMGANGAKLKLGALARADKAFFNQEFKKAFELYQSTSSWSSEAQCTLGNFYFSGMGVERNFAKAEKWYLESAEHGSAAGQYKLGLMYETGWGIGKNLGKAKKWYRKAAAQNYGFAKENLALLEKNEGEGSAKEVDPRGFARKMADWVKGLWAKSPGPDQLNVPPPYGSPYAPYTFKLWGSLTCPFTIQIIPVLKRVVDSSNGRIKLEWHHLPIHPADPGFHVLALAAGNRFWSFSNRLSSNLAGLDWKRQTELANLEGVSDKELFYAWYDSKKWASVRRDFLGGKLLGIKHTPGLFFEGYFLTPNGVPENIVKFEDALHKLVAPALR